MIFGPKATALSKSPVCTISSPVTTILILVDLSIQTLLPLLDKDW